MNRGMSSDWKEPEQGNPTEGASSNEAHPRLCSHCKSRPARPKKWDCLECHRTEMRNQRFQRKAEMVRLQRVVDELTSNNSETRRKFEQRIGRRRRVVVTPRVDE